MKYLIIGNSAAGIGAVEGIRQIDKNGEIIMITNEPYHTYSRPLISYYLSGKVTEEKMKYRSDDFYKKHNCNILKNTTVVEIDAKTKQVVLNDGKKISYDKLLAATGSSAFIPPFEGLDSVKSKHTFTSFDDVKCLDKELDSLENKRVLIIGAGLIGLKCAEGILGRGQIRPSRKPHIASLSSLAVSSYSGDPPCTAQFPKRSITVLDISPAILSSILDKDGAKKVQNHLENKRIEFKLSSNIIKFETNTAVLESGEKIDFDILILAVGVRPNTSLLKGIAEIDKGIIVNEKSETSASDIYAAGDCTQTIDISDGQNKIMALLPNAYMQGECAGINMAGGEKVFDKAIPMNAISFCGMHMITAGNYNGDIYEEQTEETYKRLYYSENKLNGYILIGNVDKAGIYTNLIREQTPLDSIDFELICKKPGLMAFSREHRESVL